MSLSVLVTHDSEVPAIASSCAGPCSRISSAGFWVTNTCGTCDGDHD
jgi:hypothetical protein